MTYEKLLEISADEIAAFDDKQLNELFLPFFTVTRPELAAKEEKPFEEGKRKMSEKSFKTTVQVNAKRAKAMELAKQLGIKLDL